MNPKITALSGLFLWFQNSNLKLVNIFKYSEVTIQPWCCLEDKEMTINQVSKKELSRVEKLWQSTQSFANERTLDLNEAAAVLSQVDSEIKFNFRRNSQDDSSDTQYTPHLVQASLAISKKLDTNTGGDPLFESLADNALVESVSDALSCMKVLNPDGAEKLLRCAMRCS